MMRRVLASLALLLVLSAGHVLAQPVAARRVVVDRFSGPRGQTARRALIRDLEEHGVVVVDESEVRAARDCLGLGRRLGGEDYPALARDLNVSAFIDGRVRRRRRRWALTVRVRNALDGESLGTASWGGRTAASLGGVRRNGYDRLAAYLEASRAPGVPVTEPAEEPWYAREEAEAPVEPEPEPEPAPRPASSRYDAFRVSVVGGTLYRFMNTPVQVYGAQRGMCDPASGCDPASALVNEERQYQSGGIGHLVLGGQAEVYPGAFGDQPFPYIGALVSFTHSVAVRSNGTDPNTGKTVSVPTNQFDFLVAVRGRYRFGEARREPEIHLDAGWGTFQFNLGMNALQQISPDTVIPPMQYGYVHVGAGINYGIIPTYLTVGLDVAYRIGTNIGNDTRNVWGTSTGPANGLLLGIELKTEIPEIVQGAFIALRVQYFQFTTSFHGQVGCAQAGGCQAYVDPWNDTRAWEVWPVNPPAAGMQANVNDVVGGPRGPVNDNYVRLQLAAGYAFY